MKTIQTLTIGLLVASTFTACHKDDATTVSPSPAAYILPDNNYVGSIGVSFKAKQENTVSLFQWNSGSLNATQLTFNAATHKGDVFYTTKFGQPVNKDISIFEDGFLGSIPMPAISSNLGSFTVGIATSGTNHALVLTGMYKVIPDMPPTPVTPIPIQVIIDEPLNLTTDWLYGVKLKATSYSACLKPNLNELTAGMSTTLMNDAVRTNGVILVTSTINANIYTMFVNNLTHYKIPVTMDSKEMTGSKGSVM